MGEKIDGITEGRRPRRAGMQCHAAGGSRLHTGKYEKDVVFQKKADTDIDEILLQAENTPMILPLGTITVTKKIKENDITWAHGNPTFFFVAEGTDLSGAAHRYEDYVTFVPDSYETDGNGYATISVTLRNIPLGQYTIWEKPVLRYYLKDAWADTENVRITKKAEATYGKDPKDMHLRIAPTFPSYDALVQAIDILCLCVIQATAEKVLLENS